MVNSRITTNIPSTFKVAFFRRKLLTWFRTNARDYPWRNTNDPFRLLIAEMMLRRTRADQVENVYINLFNKYPDVCSVAQAKPEDLMTLLYPLGLRWRVPAFQEVAQILVNKYDCKVPKDRTQLNDLPGVGEYVAGAVLSIAFNQKEWMVDSNIVRVYKRYFGIALSREGRRDKNVVHISQKYVSTDNPRNANLAILDFAANICGPLKPKHNLCTLKNTCLCVRELGY